MKINFPSEIMENKGKDTMTHKCSKKRNLPTRVCFQKIHSLGINRQIRHPEMVDNKDNYFE